MGAPRSLLILAAASALATSGCGRAEDEAAVRATAQRFLGAYQGGEGAVACAQLSEQARKKLESDERKPCTQAIAGVMLEPGSITRIEVSLDNAKVDLSSGQTAFLSDERSGWRVSAAGCEPEGGKPADRPFDCEVEA